MVYSLQQNSYLSLYCLLTFPKQLKLPGGLIKLCDDNDYDKYFVNMAYIVDKIGATW